MDKTFENLKLLQDILSRKYEVEREIEVIPRAIQTKQEILNRLKKSYIDRNEEFDKIKQDIKDRTIEMGEAERRREESEKKMDAIKTQREYEALDKEIRDAADDEQRSRRYMQRREQDLQEVGAMLKHEEKMIKMQEEELAAEHERIQTETESRQTLLKQLNSEEGKITPGMDQDILFKFQRIIRNKSGIGIVNVQGNVCTGCYMVLPAQFVNGVRNGKDIWFCPYCSRILFWKKGSENTIKDYETDDTDVGGLADLLDDEVEL